MGKKKSVICEQFEKFSEGVKPNGRPPLLVEEELMLLKEEIERYLLNEGNPTYEYLSGFVHDVMHKSIGTEALRHILHYRFDEYKGVPGIPFDEKRLQTSEKEIDTYFDKLEILLKTVHHAFCFNLDEVGQQEYCDAREVYVLVRSDYSPKTCPYPVNRNARRATALHCIATDAEYIKPMIIVPRTSLDSELDSVCPLNHFLPVHQPSGFITTDAFKTWFEEIFIPMLKEKREKYQYAGRALLILDNLRAHKKVLDEMDLNVLKVDVLFLVPHTSDQCQALDLGVFGEQKRLISSIRNEKDKSPLTNQIKKIVSTLWQASSPHRVCAAFRAAGICRETIKT
jgi:hypothetical protein